VIEVLKAKPLTLVQDLGRQDARKWGVGTAGAMDPLALQAGNLMLGNMGSEAALEVSMFPLHLRFLQDTNIAVTGADCSARLNGALLPEWWAITANAGQELVLHAPRERSRSRAYVCVEGGIEVPIVLGSRSTQLRGEIGGYEGRMVRAGDRLPIAGGDAATIDFGIVPANEIAALRCEPNPKGADVAVRVLTAGEYELFARESRNDFWEQSWRISAQSNRAGYRLEGRSLKFDQYVEMNSYPVVPGLIQVPPAGAPIVQMMDANVSGGYPKLGVVIGPDLWKLGQVGLGSTVRFLQCTHDTAVRARRVVANYLENVTKVREQAAALAAANQKAPGRRRC